MTYSSYLRIDDLLALQHEPRAHDELLFVVIHQSHELWFKLVLHELDEVTRLIDADAFPEAETRLRRIVAIMRQLTAQWDVLGTMTPAGYLEFRHVLEGGSGFQSAQGPVVPAVALALRRRAGPASAPPRRPHAGGRVRGGARQARGR